MARPHVTLPLRRTLRACAAVCCGLVALLATDRDLHAQGAQPPNLQLRLYVNAYTAGQVSQTPQDPNGNASGERPGNDGASLELILFRHVGLSFTQEYERRHFTDAAGNDVKEQWTNSFYSLTGYLKAARRGGWNLFLGASTGTIDRYDAQVNGIGTAPAGPARNLPLTRTFGGFELAFQRIGFRAQVIQSEASDTVAGQKLSLNQTLQVLSVFIPFN